jgi:3-oxoacyl-[acyl-carrier protein] reductase
MSPRPGNRPRSAARPQVTGCAMVTGASDGIGAATALALAEDGWRCGVNFRTRADEAQQVVNQITDAGGQAVAIRADVRDPADVESAFTELEEAYGPVLCLVNNAAVRADGLLAIMTDEQWSAVLRTDVDAAFMLCRRALGRMLRARWGRIINISSVAGLRGSPGQANYCAAKAGLIGLTRSLAVEVADRGITVNAVAPGLVQTRMTRDASAEIVSRIPAGRPGTPEEVAHCVRFIASARASYLTGATLPVDGGLSA